VRHLWMWESNSELNLSSQECLSVFTFKIASILPELCSGLKNITVHEHCRWVRGVCHVRAHNVGFRHLYWRGSVRF
jgi:hypothetical protein